VTQDRGKLWAVNRDGDEAFGSCKTRGITSLVEQL